MSAEDLQPAYPEPAHSDLYESVINQCILAAGASSEEGVQSSAPVRPSNATARTRPAGTPSTDIQSARRPLSNGPEPCEKESAPLDEGAAADAPTAGLQSDEDLEDLFVGRHW